MDTLDAAALAAVAEGYDLGVIVRHWPAAHGIENRNFFLQTRHGDVDREYVLTIMETPAYSGDTLVPLLETCAARGLPVPAPLRTRSGATSLPVGGRPAMVCPRLPGRHVLNPTLHHVSSVGRFVARLHRDTAMLAPDLPEYPRSADWLERRAGPCLPHLPYLRQRLLHDALREVSSLLGRGDVQQLAAGAIHGDLFRDNVLFNSWGLSGVLDFHHAARGILIYDLAVAANDWCVDRTGVVDRVRLQALVGAYAAIRPLAPAEIWHLPGFMLYAALAFWISRLAVEVDRRRGLADRAHDPEAFAGIVAERRKHCVPLDPWFVHQNVAASER